jgi:hypothetical protein
VSATLISERFPSRAGQITQSLTGDPNAWPAPYPPAQCRENQRQIWICGNLTFPRSGSVQRIAAHWVGHQPQNWGLIPTPAESLKCMRRDIGLNAAFDQRAKSPLGAGRMSIMRVVIRMNDVALFCNCSKLTKS